MTSILSSISGQFSKSLFLGTLFPTVLFVILGRMFVAPLVPTEWPLLKPLETLDTQWQAAALLLLAVVLSGLLYNLNIPIIRFYEGYPWQDTRIGRSRAGYYQARYDTALARYKGMRTLLRAMPTTFEPPDVRLINAVLRDAKGMPALRKVLDSVEGPWFQVQDASDDRRNGLQHKTQEQWNVIRNKILDTWSKLGRHINDEFPGEIAWVLPTELGNVIRSFEVYSKREYGIDSIVLWPRLIAKISAEYSVSIDDAKTSFDFMLNSSVLSALLALALLFVGLIFPIPLASARWFVPWLFEIIVFAYLARWFYRRSILRASAWGDMVKSAFDLYRSSLLEQLGYNRPLETKDAERTLWDQISRQMLYGDRPAGPQGDPPAGPQVDYAPSSAPDTLPFVRGDSNGEGLEITRGIKLADAGGVVTIVVRVRNKLEYPVLNVVLTDKMSEGFEYEWNSARIGCRGVRVAGANPYQFAIGTLQPDKEVLLTYRMIPRAGSSADPQQRASLRSVLQRLKRLLRAFI